MDLCSVVSMSMELTGMLTHYGKKGGLGPMYSIKNYIVFDGYIGEKLPMIYK